MEEQTITPAAAPVATDNYDVLVRQGNTLFMYAPIGRGETFNYVTREYQPVGVTDSDFIGAINALKAEGETDVHIRINSNGGSTKHGQAIIAAMQSCGLNIHTYNDGTAASMAAAIWACGTKRHMAKNAILMIHHPWDFCSGHAKAMRECAERLDKISEAMMLGFADAFGKTMEEVQSLYFADYTDKYFTYKDIMEQGFISPDEEEYDSGLAGKDKDAIAALVKDPFAEYRKPAQLDATAVSDDYRLHTARAEGNTPNNGNILDQIIALFTGQKKPGAVAATTITTQLTQSEMNKAELLAALKDGTLTAADVQAALAEATPPAPPATPPAAPAPTDTANAELTELRNTVAQLTQRVEAMAAAPGATRTTPGAPPSDLPTDPQAAETPQQRLERTNAALLAAAEKSEALVVTMGE